MHNESIFFQTLAKDGIVVTLLFCFCGKVEHRYKPHYFICV